MVSFAGMQSLFETHAHSLCAQDYSAVIEIAHLEHARQSLEKAIERQLLECLPSSTKVFTLDQARSSVAALQETQMHAHSSTSSQNQTRALVALLEAMARGVALDAGLVAGQRTEYWDHMMQRLEWFCSHTTEAGVATYGRQALTLHMADVEKRASEPETLKLITVGSLEVFARFAWMLSAEHKAKIQAWSAIAIENMKGDQIVQVAEKNKEKKKKEKEEPDDSGLARASVMSLFGF